MNTTVLIGRVAQTKPINYTQAGMANVRFNIAVRKEMQVQQGERDSYFFPCLAWNKNADFIEKYIGIGDLIAITGRLQTNEWNDDQGIRHSIIEINVEKIEILAKKQNNSNVNNSVNVNTQMQVQNANSQPKQQIPNVNLPNNNIPQKQYQNPQQVPNYQTNPNNNVGYTIQQPNPKPQPQSINTNQSQPFTIDVTDDMLPF